MLMELDYVQSKKSVPPQFIILAIIAKHNNITLSQLYPIVKRSRCNGISFDKITIKDLEEDLNMLHVLGLIKETEGMYTITEKGRLVLERFIHSNLCLP